MSVVPKKFAERIGYCEAHIEPFQTNATAIGTTSVAVTDLQTKTAAARAALSAQTEARVAAKAATSALKTTVNAMSIAMQDIIKQIRVKASTAGDGVYDLAQIPPPATPSSRPEPGTPSNLKVTLDGNGALILQWKCNNPPGTSGTMYQVWRKVGPTGAVEYVGGVGEKKFTDDTLPAGASQVTYQIQAARSTKVGLWGTFLVQFGVSGGGAMTASVVETTPTTPAPKIAA
jgi:hypothetical protein